MKKTKHAYSKTDLCLSLVFLCIALGILFISLKDARRIESVENQLISPVDIGSNMPAVTPCPTPSR